MNNLSRQLAKIPVGFHAVSPERLGWMDCGDGVWTHKTTGKRYVFPPDQKPEFLIFGNPTDADLRKMARKGEPFP